MSKIELKQNPISRRNFIGMTAASGAAFTILPSFVVSGLGHKAPSDKLNIAGIGIGGKGAVNIGTMETENIVALCDADWDYAKHTFDKYPNANRYWDYRKMFDEMGKSIDAVMIATADHTHAIIAADAMILGKHVFCQKPLTHSVYESRLLTQLARKYKVATQMGHQGSSSPEVRTIREWIANGELGEITEAHAWTNRPIWPQGLSRLPKKWRFLKHSIGIYLSARLPCDHTTGLIIPGIGVAGGILAPVRSATWLATFSTPFMLVWSWGTPLQWKVHQQQ